MLLRWILLCALGEALGIAAVGTAYAAIDQGMLAPDYLWILAAGSFEGLCLGSAQALGLRRLGVRPLRWIGFTVAAAAAGYGLPLLGGAGGAPAAEAEPSPAAMALMGAGLGVVMGALLGAVQGLAAHGAIGLRAWVVANAIGWAPAMAVIMLAASSVGGATPLCLVAATGAGAGALAGLCIGCATGGIVRGAAGFGDARHRPQGRKAAMPGLSARRLIVVLAHGAVGWALCGLIIAVGMSVTTVSNALVAHAILGPLAFGGVALVYFRLFRYTAPAATAALFLAVVVFLDLFVVALLIEGSLAMFTSLIGTCIPWALIFAVTYAVGRLAPGNPD